MASRWPEFDRLLHELGAISAFKAEAAGYPELSHRPEVAELSRAVEAAATAIGRITDDADDDVMLRAWTAVSRARDAADAARDTVVAFRQSRTRGLAS